MKDRLLLSFLACVLCAPALVMTAAADPTQPILPLSPTELITYLPPAPKQWIVTRSTAANTFSTWISTRAERDFKLPPPPPVPGAPAKPEPVETMNVRISDTGYNADFKALFVAPKPGSPQGGTTFLKINNFPAFKQNVDATNTNLDILIKNRYMVEIRAQNVSDDDLKSYAEAFDFTKLLSTPDIGETKLPNPVIITEVDELNPQKNRTYAVHYATPQ